jgi:hypothetical protein
MSLDRVAALKATPALPQTGERLATTRIHDFIERLTFKASTLF